MTLFHDSAISPRVFARGLLMNVLRLESEGVRNAGCPTHPQPGGQEKKPRQYSRHRYTGSPGAPHAMVLTVSFVLSPVTGLSCHRRLSG
jgi:hypothetical protein